MDVVEPNSGPAPDDDHRAMKTAAHDLNNLRYRLTLLTDSFDRRLDDPATRIEARTMLLDTTRLLGEIVDRLRRAARSGG